MMDGGSQPRCIMIIAGEASGDQHGAKLVKAVQRRAPDTFFCGIGGRAMARAGVRIVVDAAALSVVGITEAVAKIGTLLSGLSRAKRLMAGLRPDLLILIDFPDFNLRAAAFARRNNIPVLYYISPQLWAWRRGRVKKIKALVDHMAVILPFEAEFYERHGVPVTYVGHPLLDGIHPAPPPPGASEENGGGTSAPVLGLLPGSRDKEIRRHLPLLLDAAAILKKDFAPMRFLVSQAPSVDGGVIQRIVQAHPVKEAVEIRDDPVECVLRRSRLVVAVSGTVTLEAAIAETPTLIVYRVSPVSYLMAKTLVRVDHIGLINLIAGERIMPELIQQDASAANIAHRVAALINDPNALAEMKQKLAAAGKRLGRGNASDRVADIALHLLRHKDRP